MVLDHVTEGTRCFVITTARFNAERFRSRDLNVIDVTRVPQRFEDGVGKSQYQNILRGLFSEKVIDPVSLILGEGCVNEAIQFLSGGKIGPEWLFDDNAGPASFWRLV